jgi:DNA modification methylase
MQNIFGEEMKSSFLRDRYIEPPFSVLDSKQGRWQDRKRKWKALGIQSEIGRVGKGSNSFNDQSIHIRKTESGQKIRKGGDTASIFDPVLCELMYKWFCPENGTIIDPFAGGSVRGVVANSLGYKYTGIELRREQIDSNIVQAKNILEKDNIPKWICGDSEKELSNIKEKFDFILSCPPYFDLEKYSDDENDLSNMSYDDFKIKYESIIRKSIKLLKKDCFACFVVGEIRDKKTGFYRDFVGLTKQCFINNGMGFYNDIILLNGINTASLRAGSIFDSGKKLCKIHQNVLVFKKT